MKINWSIKLYQHISNNTVYMKIYNPNHMLKKYYKVKNNNVVKSTKRTIFNC